MTDNFYIAGDWGTSHLRLSLVNTTTGIVLAETKGPGIGSVERNDIHTLFTSLTKPWRQAHGSMPAILCGMVGANIGWVDAGYVECPFSPSILNEHLVDIESGADPVTIIPGLKCHSPTSAPDVMRGEETQVLGALTDQPQLCEGRHLLCLPGTHTKWVLIENGIIQTFLTSLCGELYSLLCQHSVLTAEPDAVSSSSRLAFQHGVSRNYDFKKTDLIQLLFETRSRQIAGELKPGDAGSFLSGLVIGRDILTANALFDQTEPLSTVFIGTPKLTDCSLSAAQYLIENFDLKNLEISDTTLNGDNISRAGIHTIYQSKFAGK